MWNRSVKIPCKREVVADSSGYDTEKYTYITGIPASFKSATRDDVILARQEGHAVSVMVEIMECNYNGASFLVDEENGDIYDIRRVFKKDRKCSLELTCERRLHGKIPN